MCGDLGQAARDVRGFGRSEMIEEHLLHIFGMRRRELFEELAPGCGECRVLATAVSRVGSHLDDVAVDQSPKSMGEAAL